MSAMAHSGLRFLGVGALVLILLASSPAARADLVISAAPTTQVACHNGACIATAASAVLDVTTLKTMLANGNALISTGNAAETLDIRVPVSWSTAHTLSLKAKKSISVGALVSIKGTGGLTIVTGGGGNYGSVAYDGPGRIAFHHLSSKLSINGDGYTLVNSIAGLAGAASANVNARLAFANNYDAQGDRIYHVAPVLSFAGIFDGLGNTISNLKIASNTEGAPLGLFGTVRKGCGRCGYIHHVALTKVSVRGGPRTTAGGLVGDLQGTLSQVSVDGVVSGTTGARVGGLVGTGAVSDIVQSHSSATATGADQSVVGSLAGTSGDVSLSYATGHVTGGEQSIVGGLVGLTGGLTNFSFAIGNVTAAGNGSAIGGLIGMNHIGLAPNDAILNCYARGTVKNAAGGAASSVGGLVGVSPGQVAKSYSTGRVEAGAQDVKGGFVGADQTASGHAQPMQQDYWDTTISGVSKASAGAGNIANDPGIKGLTRSQFVASLPAGFAPGVWAHGRAINSGLPYLVANPPE